jgi:hypothetical protein
MVGKDEHEVSHEEIAALEAEHTGRSRPQMARGRVLVGRYHPSMAHVTKLTPIPSM